MSETYKLTYFNIRGVAEPIRMMFAVAGVPYEDVRVKQEDWPEMKKKFTYGQVPVLQVGEDRTLAQSNAIVRYLAQKFGLNGADDWQNAKIDELSEVLVDFRTEWRKYFMERDREKRTQLKKELFEVIMPRTIGKVEEYKKAKGSKFLVGDKLTWVDIQYAHFLEVCSLTLDLDKMPAPHEFDKAVLIEDPTIMEPYPSLKELQKTVFGVPQIKKWIETRPQTNF